MKSLNIYFLSQMDDEKCFSEYDTAMSQRHEPLSVKPHEQASLRALVRHISRADMPLESYDGFFLSFVISHISKEFDLLKIARNHSMILNIELKSIDTGMDRITKQLTQNRYYLRHISSRIRSYTYVLQTDTLYTLGDDGRLCECAFSQLRGDMLSFDDFVDDKIEELFRAEDFLISPGNTPEKFLSHSYFLTTQQNDFKSQIRALIEPCLEGDSPEAVFLSLTGSPGTGKTLLLYDIASDISARLPVVMIHCGPMGEGHRFLNDHMENVSIIPSSALNSFPDISTVPQKPLQDFEDASSDTAGPDHLPKEYKLKAEEMQLSAPRLILVDEAQRLDAGQFETVQQYAADKRCACVFSFDSRQILYAPLSSRQIVVRIQSISFETLRLSDKIRANKELSSFIITLFNMKRKTGLYHYDCVDVIFAADGGNAVNFAEYYIKKGFVYIMTDADYDIPWPCEPVDDSLNASGHVRMMAQSGCNLQRHEPGKNTRAGAGRVYSPEEVTGREFDSVVMVMDSHFYFNEDGELRADDKPDSQKPRLEMLFQGISRARERLALIICRDKCLFERVNSIKLPRPEKGG